MKIPPSFRQAYIGIRPVLERLEAVVKPRTEEIALRYNGTYSGRIKKPENILIKAEKEGHEYPFRQMDDLFACTITVPNSQVIEDVRRDVEATFKLVEVRQRAVKPEVFAYNDLNLSLKVIPEFWNRGEAYLDLVFELQIKTLLQQAWSQAGHDVIYKARKKTWGLTRITSQLRALLEMADSLLANLDSAANILQGTIEYPKYSKRNQIIDILENTWDDPRLPGNLDRAALVIEEYLRLAGLTSDEFLFSAELNLQSDLEEGCLSNDFRLEFQNHNISLSNDVTIMPKEEGSRWWINDIEMERTYIVKRVGEILNVYSDDLVELLCREDYRQYVEARSLTPTQAVFIILFQEKWGDMKPRLRKRKVLITSEMLDLCPSLAKIPQDCRMVF